MLKKQEEFNEIFTSNELGNAILDINGKFLRINKKLENILQYSQEEIQGLSFEDITYKQDLDRTYKHNYMKLNGELNHFSYKERYIKKDKTIVWVDVSISRIVSSKDNVDYILLMIKDITEYKKIENKLIGLIEDFDEDFNISKILETREIEKNRLYFRMEFDNLICASMKIKQIKNKSVETQTTNVCINNIGGGGLKFISRLKLPIDATITLEFKIKTLGQILILYGHIVRINKLEENAYEYGVQFSIDDKQRSDLIIMLNKIEILKFKKKEIYDTNFCTKKNYIKCIS